MRCWKAKPTNRHSTLWIACGLGLVFALAACSRDHLSELHAAPVPVEAVDDPAVDPAVAFPESFPLQVAVYWSKSDEGILGLEHALREMGIPFFVTRDLDQALRHRLLILYPEVDGNTFTDSQIRQLTRRVQDGGRIFAVNVFAGALKPLFGFGGFRASHRRYRVRFDTEADPAMRCLNRPEEMETQLGDPKLGDIFWTNGYTANSPATVLARFDDGSAALLRNRSGKGSAYLAGVSLENVVLRSQVKRDYNAGRHYVNEFEPGADVWLLLLRGWYETNQPGAVRLATIPNGQRSVLLLSHDVDWENSFAPALDFARMEKAHHAASTFFIQTKYVSDYNSNAFFFGDDLNDLKELYRQGFSIGSHSVIHSRGFNHFDLGTGTETFPSYQPRGTGFESATGATVFGEVRVSKALLNGELPGQRTIFFRAGHLRVPLALPEALRRCGYLFDSSFTAGDVTTNFPYALPLGLGFDQDSGLYEFPVTFEDEQPPPLQQRIEQALGVIRANAEIGAINVILIHSNESRVKLPAEQHLLEALPQGVIATDMLSFARFWRARDRLLWSVSGSTEGEVTLSITPHERVEGLTFEFQKAIASVSGAVLLEDRHRILLPSLSAGLSHLTTIRYAP